MQVQEKGLGTGMENTNPHHVRDQAVLTAKLVTALRARPVAVALDQVDQLGLEAGEVEIAFTAILVQERCGFVVLEEALRGEGNLLAGWVETCEGRCGWIQGFRWMRFIRVRFVRVVRFK